MIEQQRLSLAATPRMSRALTGLVAFILLAKFVELVAHALADHWAAAVEDLLYVLFFSWLVAWTLGARRSGGQLARAAFSLAFGCALAACVLSLVRILN